MADKPVKPIPDGYHSITPYLNAQGADRLIAFLKAAFAAKERGRNLDDQGRIMHAEVQIGDSIIMLSEASERFPARETALYLYVNDADAVYRAALQAGGTSIMEPATHFYGDRSGGIKDPAGNQWWIATHLEDVSEEEMARRMRSQNKT
jgi:uncharacterized glyoxalase superfamily protein PhnB